MQARAPLWGANVGRIFTQKISRPRSHSFTRVRNLHFIQHDQSPSHSASSSFGLLPIRPLHVIPDQNSFGQPHSATEPTFLHLHSAYRTRGTTEPNLFPTTGPRSTELPHHRSTPITGPHSLPVHIHTATTGQHLPPVQAHSRMKPCRTRRLPVQIASARAHQQLYASKAPALNLIL